MNEKKTYYVNRKFKKAEVAILMSKKKKNLRQRVLLEAKRDIS